MSLVETALLLCIFGVVLAVFVPTFLRRVRTNKINEAAELLREMNERAAAYYATSWADGVRFCLPPSAGPTPTAPSPEPVDVDFAAEGQSGHETWLALGFQPERPIRYSYSFRPSADGCDLGVEGEALSVALRAEGDLDGDAVVSTFERQATIESGEWSPGEMLFVHQRVE